MTGEAADDTPTDAPAFQQVHVQQCPVAPPTHGMPDPTHTYRPTDAHNGRLVASRATRVMIYPLASSGAVLASTGSPSPTSR